MCNVSDILHNAGTIYTDIKKKKKKGEERRKKSDNVRICV